MIMGLLYVVLCECRLSIFPGVMLRGYSIVGCPYSRTVTIYRRLLICRDGHLDQSEAYDIS